MEYSPNYYKFFVSGCQRDFIRTESGWSDITDSRVLTDGEIANRDGLVPDAVKVFDIHVAELVAKSAKAKVRRSNIRRFRKEVV